MIRLRLRRVRPRARSEGDHGPRTTEPRNRRQGGARGANPRGWSALRAARPPPGRLPAAPRRKGIDRTVGARSAPSFDRKGIVRTMTGICHCSHDRGMQGEAMRAKRRSLTRALLALGLACGAATAEAQLTTGTILGTVSDSGGGVLTGATITATNLDTGFVRTARTDAAGAFTMVNLPLGRYQLKAEADGFKTKVVTDLNLVVDQKLRRDLSLEVGSIKETIEVAGQATLLQTDQPDVNQIVQEKEIKGLPLNGRDFFSLTLLSNGV